MTIEHIDNCQLPTQWGTFDMHGFRETESLKEHVALVMGDPGHEQPVLIRVHSECLTGDALFSQRCDCGAQLEHAMAAVAAKGSGIILYLRQEGRGIGLINKLKAYSLQEAGLDTVEANERLGFPADLRNYGVGAQILSDLGIHRLRLLTNNPRKIVGLESHGLEMTGRVPLQVEPNTANEKYLKTKQARMGHLFDHLS